MDPRFSSKDQRATFSYSTLNQFRIEERQFIPLSCAPNARGQRQRGKVSGRDDRPPSSILQESGAGVTNSLSAGARCSVACLRVGNCVLRRTCESSSYRPRELNGDKMTLGIKIVLSGFINDPNKPTLHCPVVRDNSVDSTYHQRRAVTNITHTHNVLGLISTIVHGLSPMILLILYSFLPMPWASCQCTSARPTLPSGKRTLAMPLRFFQRPGP